MSHITIIMPHHPTTGCDSPLSTVSSHDLSKYRVPVPAVIASLSSPIQDPITADFQPTEYDVICGRGKGFYQQPGNIRFRSIVRAFISKYNAAKTRFDKTMIFNAIIDQVQSQNRGQTRFVRRKQKRWEELTLEQTREKVGHTLRETIATLEAAAKEETEGKVSPDKACSTSSGNADRSHMFDLQRKALAKHVAQRKMGVATRGEQKEDDTKMPGRVIHEQTCVLSLQQAILEKNNMMSFSQSRSEKKQDDSEPSPFPSRSASV